MPNEPMRVTIYGAQLLFQNFSGRETQFNQAGDRNFCVVLDEKAAADMAKDGWNVKYPNPRDPEEEETRDPYLPVAVKYKIRPPKIVLISSAGRTFLTQDMVEILDGLDYTNVDLVVNASNWEVAGKRGIKAYLKTMYFTVDEDELDLKYSIPERDRV